MSPKNPRMPSISTPKALGDDFDNISGRPVAKSVPNIIRLPSTSTPTIGQYDEWDSSIARSKSVSISSTPITRPVSLSMEDIDTILARKEGGNSLSQAAAAQIKNIQSEIVSPEIRRTLQGIYQGHDPRKTFGKIDDESLTSPNSSKPRTKNSAFIPSESLAGLSHESR